MKTLTIWHTSDTHTQHNFLKPYYPEDDAIDVLVYSGDYSYRGTQEETLKFCEWLGRMKEKFPYVVVIAGNHDWIFERNPTSGEAMIPPGVIYLNDSGVEIEGFKFWGSPIQPEFCSWAFNRNQIEIQPHWDLIPSDIDVLITHGPPHLILDKVDRGPHVGCPSLLAKIQSVKPLLHCFGHIHEGYGMVTIDGTVYSNGSFCDARYNPVNPPNVITIRKA